MAGVLKLMLSTPMVTTTENVTNIIVNRRYFPAMDERRKEGH